jgi:DNA-binding FadR family transcriptional regulator
MDDEMCEVQVRAIRAVCLRLTAEQLQDMRRSVEQARLLPRRPDWDRKAVAHAEIFGVLAEATDNPVLAQALYSSARLAYRLLVTAGPVVDGITANSRERLLACLSAGDPGGAAREIEGHLGVLSFWGRLCHPKTSVVSRLSP